MHLGTVPQIPVFSIGVIAMVDPDLREAMQAMTTVAPRISSSGLLALLRAAHLLHWTAHWQSSGESFYGDHLLFERLYTGLTEEIDTLGEKIVAMTGPEGVNPGDQIGYMQEHVAKWLLTSDDLVTRALDIERTLQKVISDLLLALRKGGTLSQGMENFLQGVADTHETNIYLLQQRSFVKRLATKHLERGSHENR
jgi:DNA-binding ferritin-like protein